MRRFARVPLELAVPLLRFKGAVRLAAGLAAGLAVVLREARARRGRPEPLRPPAARRSVVPPAASPREKQGVVELQ